MPTDAPEAELTSIWSRVTDAVGAGLPASTFQLWIDPLRPVGVQDGTLYVSAPQSIRAWVERRYGAALESALGDVAEGVHRVVVVTEGTEPGGDGGSWSTAVASLPLNPEHTFERFVIGDGNRLAHAAALAVPAGLGALRHHDDALHPLGHIAERALEGGSIASLDPGTDRLRRRDVEGAVLNTDGPEGIDPELEGRRR